MRISRLLGMGIYLFGLALGSLTIVSGCGQKASNEETVPARGEPSPEERKGREDAMKNAMRSQRK